MGFIVNKIYMEKEKLKDFNKKKKSKNFQENNLKTYKHENSISSLAITKDGKCLIVGDTKGRVKILDLKNLDFSNSKLLLQGHSSYLLGSNSKYILTVEKERGNVILWNKEDYTRKRTFLLNGNIESLSMSENFIVIGDKRGDIFLLDDIKRNFYKIHSSDIRVRFITISKNEKYLAFVENSKNIAIWNIKEKKFLTYITNYFSISSLDISKDNLYLAYGTLDGKIAICDIEKGQEIFILPIHSGEVRSLLFYGKYLISASKDKTIKIIDLSNQKVVKDWKAHEDWITSLIIKDDTLISGSFDKTIKFWDISEFSGKNNIDKFTFNSDFIIEKLRFSDKIRADLIEYDKKIFTDINKGSWEVYKRLDNKNIKNSVEVKLEKPIVAKDPRDDIVDGIVGIDFGTKSTVVVYSKESEKIFPMRIGMGDWSKKEEVKHYENPTIMEFVDFKTFLENYEEQQFRPDTKWNDLTISHTAYNNLKNSHSDKFNAYLNELKQWAGDKRRKIQIEDYKENIFELEPFLEIEGVDPIEIYAYYLGLYINNQFNGIYLNYLLSFPVTYEIKVRKKILESFKRGLRKSLPDIQERINDLNVISGVSEPAAYAAVALEEYGFGEEEKTAYAIFDFGGGTTDFDFGIFRFADENNRKEERYDYVIEHFGAGGDKFLGGENLLELLAFEVFKDNKDILLQKNISFTKPPEAEEFLGSEKLLISTKESKLNMVSLIDKLRPFWERENFKEEIFEGIIEVDLFNNEGEKLPNFALKIDENKLLNILKSRIKRGVDNFFEAMREAFFNNASDINLDVTEINIFLAGNSSKSILVKESFENKIEELKKEISHNNYEGEFRLFPPLDNRGDLRKPNGKTGVAFGLIETRPGGRILVIDRNIKKDNIKFKFYLGRNRRKKFRVIIDREMEYNKWVKFINAAEEFFDVYYTSSPVVTTNNLDIRDSSIKRKSFKIDKVDENLDIYIRLVSSNSFEYAVGDGENFFNIKKVELEE